jgi:hypothetical protein
MAARRLAMRRLAIVCNIVVFMFTCFVVATDGAPEKNPYIAFTLLALLIPVVSALVLWRAGSDAGSGPGAAIRLATIVCNVALLAAICWAFVDQYPHPDEEGFVPYVVLMAITPILTVVALLRRKR